MPMRFVFTTDAYAIRLENGEMAGSSRKTLRGFPDGTPLVYGSEAMAKKDARSRSLKGTVVKVRVTVEEITEGQS